MKIQELTELLEKRKSENPDKIVLSYYEVVVASGLNKDEQISLLKLAETKLNNDGYEVYFEGEKYFYKDKFYDVLPQEKLVAIKERR